MDNRWIAIILILIIGCLLSTISVLNSETAGHAILGINDNILTLPEGFSGDNIDTFSVYLINKYNQSITIKDLKTNTSVESLYKTEYNRLNNSPDIKITNTSINSSNYNIHTIYYKNKTTHFKYSISYTEKYDHKISLKLRNFTSDYANENINYIMDSLKKDFKKNI